MLNEKINTKIKRRLKALINIIKAGITYPYDQKQYLKNTIKKFIIKEGKYAIVNLDQQLRFDDHSRYLYIICKYLEMAGFKVIVKTSLRDFRSISKYGFQKFIWNENYIFVRECSTTINTIMLVQPDFTNHAIHLSYGFNLIRNGQFDWIAPYPAHPSQFKYYLDPSLQAELENSTRRIKILFAGKTTKDLYAAARVKKFFNVLSRLEVVQFILNHFGHCTRSFKNESDKLILKQLLDSDDYANDIILSEIKSKEEDWLKILSKTDFFICPPGATMPWCHNCVEAMSVGVIPILEYADLFHPALQHMKNCLSYTNYEELEAAIKKALAMDTVEIEALRKNVLEYYNKYLSIHIITKKINTFCNSSLGQLKVAIPFIPSREERRSIPARVVTKI